MKKILIPIGSILLVILLVVVGWLNTLVAIDLGKAYQTIRLVKILEHAELEDKMRRLLYSEMTVYRCQLKADKNIVLLRFTLGKYMGQAEAELEQIIQQKYVKEHAELASSMVCQADKG